MVFVLWFWKRWMFPYLSTKAAQPGKSPAFYSMILYAKAGHKTVTGFGEVRKVPIQIQWYQAPWKTAVHLHS